MKKLIATLSIIVPLVLNAQVSIYNIQYTTNPGDGTYPSGYAGQVVTTGGIVTATDYSGGRFFISSSQGGGWNGLFIYDNNFTPTLGDSVLITGTVYEYRGYTEIKDVTSYSVISTGNSLPPATKIAASDVSNEAYEGVLVEVNVCEVSTAPDYAGNWQVNDGSGACEILPGMFNLYDSGYSFPEGYPLNSVKGVIGIYGSTITIHPRFIDDIQSGEGAIILLTEDITVLDNSGFSLPVKISILNQTETVTEYSLNVQYDETLFEYIGFRDIGTKSESGTIGDFSTTGNIILNYTGSFTFNKLSSLIELQFTPLDFGASNLSFSGSSINGNPVTFLQGGELTYASSECDIPIGDTLTIIQRPILNIPSIVVPGQKLNIICFAPENTTNWSMELLYDNHIVPLDVSNTSYNTDLASWTLTTTIPNVEIYELYDLKITASGNIEDVATNAVKVIDTFKTNYYFVHITDTHLPTHEYYPGGTTDTTELNDLYEVIKDINLIRPEFVLLTGDLINEGELEDFECRRNHTRSVRLLEKFEVPVYIVPGNHDLGGWDDTPPSQGTARREWWRFFGWRQREIPPVKTEFLTHDYSFNYGNIHFVGLEAYDNYDGYMYDVYGGTSFIPSQLTWLNNDLASAGSMKKVLFYHYDFKHELNLSSLGVDMALWGHNHKNTGDINSHPYNLSTAAVCDGKRALRVIRVENDILQAEHTIQTHSSGDMLTLNFNMVNDGSLDSVSASIKNKYAQEFASGLVKFIMPISDYGYSVTNGKLLQTITKENLVECYVEVIIPSNNSITVSIVRDEFTEDSVIYDVPIASMDEGIQ